MVAVENFGSESAIVAPLPGCGRCRRRSWRVRGRACQADQVGVGRIRDDVVDRPVLEVADRIASLRETPVPTVAVVSALDSAVAVLEPAAMIPPKSLVPSAGLVGKAVRLDVNRVRDVERRLVGDGAGDGPGVIRGARGGGGAVQGAGRAAGARAGSVDGVGRERRRAEDRETADGALVDMGGRAVFRPPASKVLAMIVVPAPPAVAVTVGEAVALATDAPTASAPADTPVTSAVAWGVTLASTETSLTASI